MRRRGMGRCLHTIRYALLHNHDISLICSCQSGTWKVLGGASGLGLGGETWQDVTGIRVLNTTYINNAGKTISLSLNCNMHGAAGNTSAIYVDGLPVQMSQTHSGPNAAASVFSIIPKNSSYSAYCSWGHSGWFELR
jgi:hypothetical protein